jgi:polyisoprenoid-binding protein YceI
MRNKISQLALSALIASVLAAPALAQTTSWKLNSDRSTSRLALSSTADPDATVEAGIARVKGSAILDAASIANSSFDLTIYSAGQDAAAINKDGSVNLAGFANVPSATIINFKSKAVKLTADGNLAVTGNLTLTRVERPVTINDNEAYSGPVYGEPEAHSTTREVTFVFDNAGVAAGKTGNSRTLNLAASAGIKREDFPGLFEAITNVNWPVVAESENCQAPATTGEDYQGPTCTGTPVVTQSNPPVSLSVGEDYPAPDASPAPIRDSVKIVLNLELTRDSSAGAAAAGN